MRWRLMRWQGHKNSGSGMTDLTPERLLEAYCNGYFPMALTRDDPELYWFSPEERGVIPLDNFHIPSRLKRAMETCDYTLTVDQDFEAVIRGCGARAPTRDDTWINEQIVELYAALYRMGHAHSIEVWQTASAGDDYPCVAFHGEPLAAGVSEAKGTRSPSSKILVGGLYGVSIGGAFFGESMFSRATNASKIALVALVAVLREAGYQLLDTQYVNDHLKQFGVVAIPKQDYITKLENALSASPSPSSRFSTASVRKGLASSSKVRDTVASWYASLA